MDWPVYLEKQKPLSESTHLAQITASCTYCNLLFTSKDELTEDVLKALTESSNTPNLILAAFKLPLLLPLLVFLLFLLRYRQVCTRM